jgi:hypothetical protein
MLAEVLNNEPDWARSGVRGAHRIPLTRELNTAPRTKKRPSPAEYVRARAAPPQQPRPRRIQFLSSYG